MGIGSKLSKLLDANNTNANELANKIGVSPQTIYSIIKRDSKKADIEVLLKIADTFGVSAEYFVYDEKPFLTNQSQPKITKSEIAHIKKYRALDGHGKKNVDNVLENEYERCTTNPLYNLLPGEISFFEVAANSIEERNKIIHECMPHDEAEKYIEYLDNRGSIFSSTKGKPFSENTVATPMLDAARTRTDNDISIESKTQDDALMDDENF